HCMRDQVVNLCELKNQDNAFSQLGFVTGSLGTLRRMVDMNQGITILPEMAAMELPPDKAKNIRHFKDPIPLREIGIVTPRYFARKKVLSVLTDTIVDHLPAGFQNQNLKPSSKHKVIAHEKG